MNLIRLGLVLAVAATLAACSFQNRNEREAERITRAVVDNNLKPVENDIAEGVAITRVKVAEWSDELNSQGKLLSLKETKLDCPVGWHCFDVRFEKHHYLERMRFDENGKVVNWNFHMAQQPAQ
ncbi:MAG: hypothetical protein JO078_06670 [Candidatus Eremiobacteraeota bacterium]|nr:hypothetical protein [Candidatus Eremiobacteraeota bacterium]MBV9055441.1 hypothetical protein [Candidatus Eremiobacteraeota bacterium]MBV9699790.1 hypothetical protein [Candidatus Eremiobacteraeota bacterium]